MAGDTELMDFEDQKFYLEEKCDLDEEIQEIINSEKNDNSNKGTSSIQFKRMPYG